MARHSSSTVLYRDWVGDSDALPHWIRASLSLYLCTSAKPMPCSRDASVRTTVLTRGSNGCRVVGEVKAAFVCLKSDVCSGSHTQGVSFRSSCLRWLVRQALSGENAPNWATRPRNERSSLIFSGCLNSRRAANFSSSGGYRRPR